MSSRVQPGQTDHFVYSSQGQLMYEEQEQGKLRRSHVYLGGKLIAYHDATGPRKSKGNLAPVAKAGADQTVNKGERVKLSGAASSDPENQTLTYQWTVASGTPLTFEAGIKPSDVSFIAPNVTQNTTWIIKLTVTDPQGKSHSDEVFITVRAKAPVKNIPPVANAGPDQTVNEGDTVIIDGTGSHDPDGRGISIQWSQVSGEPLHLKNGTKPGTIEFVAPNMKADSVYVIRLTVTDLAGASAQDEVRITVLNSNKVNLLPVANAGPDQTVNEGDVVILDAGASYDPDGGVGLSLQWSAPAAIKLQHGTKPGTLQFVAPAVTKNTTYTLKLIVTDGQGATGTDSMNVTVVNSQAVSPVAHVASENTVKGQ